MEKKTKLIVQFNIFNNDKKLIRSKTQKKGKLSKNKKKN